MMTTQKIAKALFETKAGKKTTVCFYQYNDAGERGGYTSLSDGYFSLDNASHYGKLIDLKVQALDATDYTREKRLELAHAL